MFKPRLMSRVELVVPERYVVPITEALAASGVFHLTRTSHVPPEAKEAGEGGEWQSWAAQFTALERRIKEVMASLSVDEGPPPSEVPHLITPEVAEAEVQRLEKEAEAPVRGLEDEQRRLAQLQRLVAQLEPIADLQTDLGELRNLRYLFVLPGTMPTANVERLRSSLEYVPSVLVTLRQTEHLATVVLFGMQRDADILSRAARSAYLNPVAIPDTYRGTPAQAIAALQAGIERSRRRLAEWQEEIARLRENRVRHLRLLLWRVRASGKLAETITHYGRLHYTYIIAGWVPSVYVSRLEKLAAEVSEQIVVEVGGPEGEDVSRIPVALDNPPLLRAFQGLVTNYGQPSYGELDPTPLVALTFPLVFGIMFGDVGHGLLLVLIGLLLASGRIHKLRRAATFGPVMVACGALSMLFGFAYGSVFGSEQLLPAIWIRPLNSILTILLVTVGVGVVLLNLGMLYNIVNCALARRWGRMVFDRNGLAGLVLYWSLLGLAASLFVPGFPVGGAMLAGLAVLAALVVTLSEPLERLVGGHRPLVHGGFGTYVIQALVELFETVITMFSNTLSYVRMGAFAVAHGALSLVVSIIAGIISPAGGIGAWVVLALGNLFVLGFEGMIVAIQTLRLEYYELFSKFFSGGGARFRPLSLIPRTDEP
jgi:V/A-type H+-transporting ATPase subunit I